MERVFPFQLIVHTKIYFATLHSLMVQLLFGTISQDVFLFSTGILRIERLGFQEQKQQRLYERLSLREK